MHKPITTKLGYKMSVTVFSVDTINQITFCFLPYRGKTLHIMGSYWQGVADLWSLRSEKLKKSF